jgi:ATP-dependent Clp protease protease subunit
MAIYDTMIRVSLSIRRIVTGIPMSMGSILLSGANKGNRFFDPSSRVSIHQPLILGQIVAHAGDTKIQATKLENASRIQHNLGCFFWKSDRQKRKG